MIEESKTAWRECGPLAHRILNTTYFERTKISPADLLFGQALNLDRGIFLSDSEMDSDKPESLSAHMAKMLRTQSDLMHIHRQILQSTDAERLAKAPQASHAFENDSYVLLETIDGPKDSLHTRRLGSYKILSSNKNYYRLQDLISKREF